MSEPTTMLKVGTASLVLEMIEAGVSFRDFALDNPIRAIREVSHDVTGKKPVRLAGGRQASALDIQREYHAKAVEHLRNREPDQIEEHTSELQSLMRISYAVFCLKQKQYNQRKMTQ